MKRIDLQGRTRFRAIVVAAAVLAPFEVALVAGLPAIALPGAGALSFKHRESIQASGPFSAPARAGLGPKTISGAQVQTLLSSLLFLNLTTVKPAIVSKEDIALTDAIGRHIKAGERPEIADLLALYNLRMKEKHYLAALSCVSFISFLHSSGANAKLPSVVSDSDLLKTKLLAGRELLERAEDEAKSFEANSLLHLKLAKTLLQSSGDKKLIERVDNDIQKLEKSGLKPHGYAGFLMLGNVVNGVIQYSPASFCKTIKVGDCIVSVDGVSTAGLSSQRVRRLLDGMEPNVAKLKVERGKHHFGTSFKRGEPLPTDVPDGLSAQQYLQLASQLREVCRFEDGRLALVKAQKADANGPIAERAAKMLSARFPKVEPSKQAITLYSSAYWLHQDKSDAAEKVLQRCIASWPEFELPYRQLASVYRSLGRLAEAKATLVQLLKINPNYARGWCDLSQIKSDLKDFDGAMIDAKHAVELDPDDAVVNSWLAELGTKDSKVK
jgi:tetratricopeptide (TPR) repeat protein